VAYTELMAEAVARFILRLPTDVHESLTDWAKEEERSLNAHILYLLRRALREWRRA
jgi:hypothetical protein